MTAFYITYLTYLEAVFSTSLSRFLYVDFFNPEKLTDIHIRGTVKHKGRQEIIEQTHLKVL